MIKFTKSFLIVFIVMSFVTCFGQENSINNQSKHEFRLDAFEVLAISNLEISYEYLINTYSGVGLTASINLGGEYKELQTFAINPYYRQYFNKKAYVARGLFVEGALRFAGGEDTFLNFGTKESWFDVGIGAVMGYKWVSDTGFVLEVNFGGGRYLKEGFFIRGGVLIGYRFL